MAKYVIHLRRKDFSKKHTKKLVQRLLRAGGGVSVIFT